MRRLPSAYDPVLGLYKSSTYDLNYYFDTGITADNNTNVNVLFGTPEYNSTINTAVFGARRTNSTSSADQLNLVFANTSEFGYGTGRSTFRIDATIQQEGYVYYYFSNKANVMNFNMDNTEQIEVTRNTATFTGTYSIYAMAINSAGSPLHGSSPVMTFFYMSITKDGTLASDLYPVRRISDGQVGLYDFVQNSFILPSGGTLTDYSTSISVASGGNGQAVIHMPHGDYSKIWVKTMNTNMSEVDFGQVNLSMEAYPDEGYVFSHWTNNNGTIVSRDRVLHEIPSAYGTNAKVFTAHFVKINDLVQKDSFFLLGLQYGGIPYGAKGRDYDIYSLIRNFSIKEDGLTKTTSTITLESIPSVYQTNMPVAIYTSRGKFIWAGIIESIDDNTLSCREGLSILDEDFVFVPNSSYGGINLTNYALPFAINKYTGKFFTLHTSSTTEFTDTNGASERKGETFFHYSYAGVIQFDNTLNYDNSKNVSLTMPLISETEVSNLEDYLIELFNSTGYGVHATVYNGTNAQGKYKQMMLEYYYPNRNEELIMSDDYENITNVNVSVESQQYTVLEVFNEAGTTCRGVYGMQTDGTISDMIITDEKPLETFIGYTDCKTATILSDDNINTVLVQYLSNSKYNHIITFDIDLNNCLYDFEDFEIGRRVRFYHDDKVYESVVTGKEYGLDDDQDSIKTMKVTLGKVRRTLTDKIKLSNLKKKR